VIASPVCGGDETLGGIQRQSSAVRHLDQSVIPFAKLASGGIHFCEVVPFDLSVDHEWRLAPRSADERSGWPALSQVEVKDDVFGELCGKFDVLLRLGKLCKIGEPRRRVELE
jgi:hypothetical protein